MGVDLKEFAVPDFADVVRGRKIVKTAAYIVRGKTLRKRLGSGSKQTNASGVIPTNSVKQTSWEQRDFFTNSSP